MQILRLKSLMPIIISAVIMLIPACTKNEPQISEADTPSPAVTEDTTAQDQEKMAQEAAEEEQRLAREAAEAKFRSAKIKFMYEDVPFKKGSYQLSAEAREILRRKAEFLRRYPETIVIIEGHTDEKGSREFNITFGERRSGAVKSFLIKQGIESERLIAVSYGRERPIDTRNTEAARAKNRRVHFTIK